MKLHYLMDAAILKFGVVVANTLLLKLEPKVVHNSHILDLLHLSLESSYEGHPPPEIVWTLVIAS